MLHVLAKNPVFAANPACLADFVKTLVSNPAQAIPTPQPPQDPKEATPTTYNKLDQSDSPGKLARKQFWSQFKRKKPDDHTVSSSPAVAEPSQQAKTDVEDKELQALLTKPTLVLGEDDGAESVVDEKVQVIDSQATELAQPVTSSQTPVESQVPDIPVTSSQTPVESQVPDIPADGSAPEPMLPDRQRFPEEMTDGEQVETPQDPTPPPPPDATPTPQDPTPSPPQDLTSTQGPTPSPTPPDATSAPQDPTLHLTMMSHLHQPLQFHLKLPHLHQHHLMPHQHLNIPHLHLLMMSHLHQQLQFHLKLPHLHRRQFQVKTAHLHQNLELKHRPAKRLDLRSLSQVQLLRC